MQPAFMNHASAAAKLDSMFRAILVTLLLLAAAAVALWQFDVIDLPFGDGSLTSQEVLPDLHEAAAAGNVTDLQAALAAGTPADSRDQTGATPLMVAGAGSARPELLKVLLDAGANVNASDNSGFTPLLLAARDSRQPDSVLLLLNAGADPTVRGPEGETAADLAAANPSLNATRLLPRLQELADAPFDPEWPSGYVVPVDGATISSRISHLPGALRAYRNGRHEGFDFYQGTVSVPITYGTPIQAVAGGTVIRADHDYVEMSQEEYDRVIEESRSSLSTPPEHLDRLRGMQVWIEHPGGFVSRYAHLSGIAPELQVGAAVTQGQTVGFTGNSGTLEAVQLTEDDPHPHVEIWQGDTVYLGAGLEPEELYALAGQVFGQAALPAVFTD